MTLSQPAPSRLAALLDRLEAAWREQGAPIADHLAPGATEEELSQWEAESGARLPPELRIWWGWHNGAVGQPPGGIPYTRTIGRGSWEFLSLEDASGHGKRRLSASWRPYGGVPAEWQGEWGHDWLPVVTMDAYCLFVDRSAVTPEGSVPVRMWAQMPDDVFTPWSELPDPIRRTGV